ncbi:MAG: peptidoglycan DD-metalloendopeptidase family protein [Ilumatobacteraceae bacterium]
MFTFIRRLVATAIAVASLLPAGVATAAPCWHPPVTAPVTDPFRQPACRWCPGNRGIEYGTPAGASVSALATGRVSYAGTIAGVGYLVVRLAEGRRVTYGNITAFHSMGDLVVRGSAVGVAAGRFHLGLRDGEEYVDPSPYLGRWSSRPRLIPTDGSSANPPGPPRVTCSRT